MWIFSGRRLLDLCPCSALLGSTVDTCFFHFTEAFVLGSCDRFSSCSPVLCFRARVDNGIGVLGMVLLVSTHFALFFSFCYRKQRTAWSSVVHVMRQSTEW